MVGGDIGADSWFLCLFLFIFIFIFLTFRFPSFFDWVRVRESGVGKLGALDLSTRVVLFLLDFSRPLGLDLAANTVSFFKRNFSPTFSVLKIFSIFNNKKIAFVNSLKYQFFFFFYFATI